MAAFTLNRKIPAAEIIASCASTPGSALRLLSRHRSLKVRTAVADNENTSDNTAMRLAHDSNADLRYAVAENHHIHRNILNFLTEDSNPFVADRAQKTILRLKQEISRLAFQPKKR